MFVRTVAEFALVASIPGHLLLRPVLIELKRYLDPQSGPAVLDDPELAQWLRMATMVGNVLSFVSGLAAFFYIGHVLESSPTILPG